MWKRMLGMSAALFIISFAIRFFLYRFVTIPWIIYDEYIYLDMARHITRGWESYPYVRDLLYPAMWPIILSATTGFFHEPFTQYRAALFVVMIISSMIPVGAYWYFRRLAPALLMMVFSPLVVYSGSIMSETIFSAALFGFIVILHMLLERDMDQKTQRRVGAVVLGFLMAMLYHIRTFGIVIAPAFVGTLLVLLFVNRRYRDEKKRLTEVLLISSLCYIAVMFLGRFLTLGTGSYERSAYVAMIWKAFTTPLTLRLIANELVVTCIQLFFFLPFVFVWGTVGTLRGKKWGEFAVRVFLIILYVASLALTVLHMLKDAPDKQYLVFTRYMDPVIVLIAMYAILDFVTFSFKKMRVSPLVVVLYSSAVLYSMLWLYRENYKFGNNMGIFYLVQTGNSYVVAVIAPALIAGLGMLIGAIKQRGDLVRIMGIALIMWYTLLSLHFARTVPRYIVGTYKTQVYEMEDYRRKNGYLPPLCIDDKSSVSAEFYYIYGFMSGRTLAECSVKKETRIVQMMNKGAPIKAFCRPEAVFPKRDVIYYCP